MRMLPIKERYKVFERVTILKESYPHVPISTLAGRFGFNYVEFNNLLAFVKRRKDKCKRAKRLYERYICLKK